MTGGVEHARYAALFATESRTLLASAVAALAALERAADDDASTTAVDAVFRAVHSLKGMAGAMEYAAVETLAHELETVLARVRDGTLPATPLVTDMLVRGVDAIDAAVEAAVAGRPASAAPSGATPVPVAEVAESASRTAHVRVERARLDALLDVAGELALARARLAAAVGHAGDAAVAAAVAELTRLVAVLHDEVRSVRTAPAAEVFERLPRVVRDIARSLGKRADLVVEGGDVALDRAVLEELTEPLLHLLRNAVDHGLEAPNARRAAGKRAAGLVVLRAARDRDAVVVSVHDDGAGIDRERVSARARAAGVPVPNATLDDAALLAVLARPGFSTARNVGSVSGRGVGVDAVQERLRRVGGTLELSTRAGEGTCFTMRLPLTLALGRTLVARVGGDAYALPVASVCETAEVTPLPADDAGGETTQVRGELLPVVRLADILGVASPSSAASNACATTLPRVFEAAVIESGGRRLALIVDVIDGQQDLVVKRMPPVRGALRIFGGVTILPDGTPALVLDAPALLHRNPA